MKSWCVDELLVLVLMVYWEMEVVFGVVLM